MIVLNSVAKSFGEVSLFDDLSLTVSSGETVCLLGPSGCGKTTLLNIMAGLLAPESGSLTRTGRLTYVFQEARLLPWETVLGNAMYGMDPHESKAIRTERAHRMLEKLELAEAHGKRPSEISGGMARRVALARALLAPFDNILLDEPFSFLDPSLRSRIVERIGPCIQEKTAVLVTHDSAATALAHRIYTLSSPPTRLRIMQRN